MLIYFTLAIITIILRLYFFKQKYYEFDHPTIIATIFVVILLLIPTVIGMLKSMGVLIIICYAAILFPESINELIKEKYIEISGWLGMCALFIVLCTLGVYLGHL